MGALGPIYPLWARRRPRRVRFWRFIFLVLTLFCTHPFCTQPLKVTSELLRRSSLLEVSLKLVPDQLLVSLRECFCRKSVCVLLILGCLIGDKGRTGMTGGDVQNQYLFASICSCIFLHTCTCYSNKTYKCAVTVVATLDQNGYPKAFLKLIQFLLFSAYCWLGQVAYIVDAPIRVIH